LLRPFAMAILQALIAFITRSFGRILSALFDWAVVAILSDLRPQVGANEAVDVAIQDTTGVARLQVRAQVLHHPVRLEHVRPDLVAPARLDVLALHRGPLRLAPLDLFVEEARHQDLHRHVAIAAL
jgi:hypothetical protein